MRLLHATPGANCPSILKDGLRASLRRGKLPGVWLHTPGMTAEIIRHLAEWHGVDARLFKLLIVTVPRSWLRHHDGRKGVWICGRSIPARRIKRLEE